MSLHPTFGTVGTVVACLLIVALGVAVGAIRPRRPQQVAFAAYALAFGIGSVSVNLYWMSDPADKLATLGLVGGGMFFALSAAALTWLVALTPRPETARTRRIVLAGALAGLSLASVSAFNFGGLWTARTLPDGLFGAAVPWALGSWLVGLRTYSGAAIALLFMLALEYRHAAPGPDRSQRALVSAAIALWLATSMGALVPVSLALTEPAVVNGLLLVAVLALAGLWLWTMWRTGGDRGARGVALTILASTLLGMSALVWTDSLRAALTSGVFGIARLATALVLAYAIVRHRLLGIDVKVKWTIKQSTVAATFIAVIFVVSEGAQEVFAESVGVWPGLAAAGLLVFAIHPLQHLAQRVADKAMPGVRAVGEMTTNERLDLYREQLRAAWADGQLSADERKLLRVTRDKLGIGAEDALRIEEEVAPG